MNLTEKLDKLGPIMHAHNADPLGPVTIRNETGLEITDIVASLGRTIGEDFSPGASTLRSESQDFFVNAEDLDFGSGVTTPSFGWEIERANGEVFRVVGMGSEIPPFEYVTASRERIRIRTSRVA